MTPWEGKGQCQKRKRADGTGRGCRVEGRDLGAADGGEDAPGRGRSAPSARFARQEPRARAPAGPLCQQPAPLGRTSRARRPLLCALEAPLVHPVSFGSYEDRHLLLQPSLNRGWRGATAGEELKGVPLSDCMIKQKCTM